MTVRELRNALAHIDGSLELLIAMGDDEEPASFVGRYGRRVILSNNDDGITPDQIIFDGEREI